MPRSLLPKLPRLLERKLYKTGQTRGADDDEIYQNRVSRSSTVLIPYRVWAAHFTEAARRQHFEKGFIVLLSPLEYFGAGRRNANEVEQGLELGQNALVFYETREHWNNHNPARLNWIPATSRISPLGGQYIARVPATTSMEDGNKIVHGFDTTRNKGAGIRVYEYADEATVQKCRLQLEALFWFCRDSHDVAQANNMLAEDADRRRIHILQKCSDQGLVDIARLTDSRILNRTGQTICPLCRNELSASDFFQRMEQADGREVLDLTITRINLFHIEELRMGEFNHRPYNLGWGHHHCNVVVKDSGILETLRWMKKVVNRNVDEGHFPDANNVI